MAINSRCIGPPGGLAAISALCPIFDCIMCQSGDITLRILLINVLGTIKMINDKSWNKERIYG
jgi:hypothetical protein